MLEMVNDILARGKDASQMRRLFDPYLHPRGIKELGAPKSFRIASAMIDLLGTLDSGNPEERLSALRAVREEVLHDSSHRMRLNVGRVLLQIMKEIVRTEGTQAKQLALAHDFREASSGNARLIRRQLRKYHLLEMPEDWNQLAFDHHVHDANTKGRKSPTHLVMDAWIKGIRFLGVVYYGHVRPEAAAELLEAAEIMNIDVRIGIEVSAHLRDKYANFVWAPRGFLNRRDFVSFLGEPDVRAFMEQGKAVAAFEKEHVLDLLRSFNRNQLPKLNDQYGLAVPPLDEAELLAFVAGGQASLVHLGEFAHATILPHLRRRVAVLAEECRRLPVKERANLLSLIDSADKLVPEVLVEEYLRPDLNPDLPDPRVPRDDPDVPEILRCDTSALLARIERLPCRYRITLNPSNLTPADVLEILYDGKGKVTHLEIFNSKDWAHGRTEHRSRINEIRLVINSGNVVKAKRLVREVLQSRDKSGGSDAESQKEKLRAILKDLPRLLDFYRHDRLRSRLGSDSIGRSRHSRGMGLVVIPTLPWRARRRIWSDPKSIVPVATTPLRQKTDIPPTSSGMKVNGAPFVDLRAAGFWGGAHPHRVTWSVGHNTTTLAEHGNIASLGGIPEETGNGFVLNLQAEAGQTADRPSLNHLNTGTLNAAKIVIGFLPAFFTFYLTKDWWLLAYFGALIWFGITGVRNILQSVVGGGGLVRTSLLTWRDFISWSRVADSLLFTGFSVPLLDFLVKDLVLARAFAVTTSTNAILLYSIIALANGLYISSHNTYRGLPLAAIVGNFFRTVLSIPLAVGLNYAILRIVIASGVTTEAAQAGLQLWAAVISKAASDCVAAIIEGSADRQHNLAHRFSDFREKIDQVYDVYGRLEMLFPEDDVMGMLERPKELVKTLQGNAVDILRLMVINSLDLLYFWMYQPRSATALAQLRRKKSPEEVLVLVLSQRVLTRKRVVSEMLLDGLVGKRFERALAFYLSRTDRYLASITKLAPPQAERPG